MKHRTYQYILLIAIALGLLFVVSCGEDGTEPTAPQQAASGRGATSLILPEAAMISNGPDNQSQPRTAYDPIHDKFLVVWSDSRTLSSADDIYGAFINALDGSVFISDFPISTATDFESTPDVAYDYRTDRFLVVWTNSTVSSTQVYGQFLNSAAPPYTLGSPFVIPRIATEVTGAWRDSGYDYHPDAINNAIVGDSIYFGDGISQSVSNTLSFNNSADANVAANLFGDDPVVRPGTLEIYVAGSLVAWDNKIDDLTGLANFSSIAGSGPERVVDEVNSSINYDTGEVTLYFSIGNEPAAAAAITADYRVNANLIESGFEEFTYYNQSSPRVVYNKIKQRFDVVWLDETDKESSYYYVFGDTRVCSYNFGNARPEYGDTSDSNLFTFPYINTGVDNMMVRYRSVYYGDAVDATDSDGDGSPVDTEIFDASASAYAIYSDVVCGLASETLTIELGMHSFINETSPDISYNPVSGLPVVAWSGQENNLSQAGYWMASREFSAGGWTGWSATFFNPKEKIVYDKSMVGVYAQGKSKVISFGVEEMHNVAPSMDFDPYKTRLLVAWEAHDDSVIPPGKDVFGQVFDLQSFAKYGPLVNISTVQYDQSAPSVSYDSVNQRYMVVWEDARNTAVNLSNMDVFGQFVDPQGQLSGSNFPVTVDSSNQISPALDFGDVDFREFLVVWKDGRIPGESEIFGQLWQFSTAPQLEITYDDDGDGIFTPLYDQNIDFGGVAVDSRKVEVFRVENKGNAALIINDIIPGANVAEQEITNIPFFMNTAPPTSINPGSYHEMDIVFLPPAPNNYSGVESSLKFVTNGGTTTIYFSGYGIGTSPQIDTLSLPDAAKSTFYNAAVEASLGTPAYTWILNSGDLPDGLSLNSTTGEIYGIPTTAPVSNTFAIEVSDSADPARFSQPIEYTINVGLMAITTTTLPTAYYGVKYLTDAGLPVDINGIGETGTHYTWTVAPGSLPEGLSLYNGSAISNTSIVTTDMSVIINGTPTDVNDGTSIFTLTFENSGGSSTSREFSIVRSNAVKLNPLNRTTFTLSSAVDGQSYDEWVDTTGGNMPFAWKIIAGALPPGINMCTASTGNNCNITGTPTASGNYSFVIRVDAENGTYDEKLYDITVSGFQITTETLKSGSTNTPYSDFILLEGGTAPYSWTLSGGTTFPYGVDFKNSVTTAKQVEVINTGAYNTSSTGTHNLTVQVTDSGIPTPLVTSKEFSIEISDLYITTVALSDAVRDQEYWYELKAEGGNKPYTWSVVAGDPAGLTLNPNTGVLSGTPSIRGTYDFVVRVADYYGVVVEKLYSISVADFSITTATLLPAIVGQDYTFNLETSGGVKNSGGLFKEWVQTGLPSSMTINSTTGVIINSGLINSGDVGTYPVIINVTDYSDPPLEVSKEFSLTVTNLYISTVDLPSGVIGQQYSEALDATGGDSIYSWSVVVGTLPGGLTLNQNTGYITGVPSELGTLTFVVRVMDSTGAYDEAKLSITIGTLEIKTSDLPNVVVGNLYNTTVIAEGGVKNSLTGEYQWEMGGQPSSVAINPNTGEIYNSGGVISNDVGLYTVTVNATDFSSPNLKISKNFQLRVTNLSITDPPEVQDAPSSIAVGVVNEEYSKTLLASGGAQPYTWKVIAGQQPDGLSLNQYTGVISGTPTQLGTYVFLVELTDNDGIKAQRLISHTVSSFSITTSGLPNVVVGNLYNTTVSAEGGVKNSLTGEYRWEMGGQPSNLAINFDTGEIYNTGAIISNDVGLYTVTVNATDYTLAVDNGPLTVSSTFQLRVTNLSITDPPEVQGAPSSIAVGVVSEDYNKTLLASGGAQPYTWKVIAGQLPDGLSLNQYTGVISGTPTQLGTYVFLVELTDNDGIKAQRLISHTVSSFSITTVDLPNVVVGNLYNTTVSAEGGVKNSLTGYYRWEMGGQPASLAINFDTGEIYNTGAIISNDVGLYTVTVNATDYTLAVDNGPLTVSSTFQLRVTNLSITDPPEVQGAPSSIAVGVVNEEYSKTLLASGGAQPYTWKVIAGQLPDGLSLNQYTGVISGTPTQLGTYVFLVELTDNDGIKAQRLISHTVSSFSITTVELPNVVVGNLYNTTVIAEGGVKNSLTGYYRWAMGGQPSSVAINPDTGEIYNSGGVISNDVGLYTVIVNATDYTLAVDNGPLTVSRTFQLRVTNLSITDPPEALGGAPSSIAVGVVNEEYSKTLLASGGAQPYTWKVIAGQQPDGLSLNQYTGVISGTPTQLGTYVFLVELTDNDGITAQRLISHTVSEFSITTVDLPNVVVGNLYNTTVSAEGGVKNSLTGYYRWEIGGQPSSLAINFDTGEIYNTGAIISNDVGLYTVTVNATDYTLAVDNGPLTVSSTFQLRVTNLSITDPPEVQGAPSSIAVGVVSEDYNKTLLASGGAQPYTWKVIAGQLPDGLSLNQYTGVISGTPTQLGTYVFLVELTDNDGIKAQRLISHTVSSFSITTSGLPNVVVGNLYNTTVSAEGGVKNSLTGYYRWEMGGQPASLAINFDTGEIYNTGAMISNDVGLYTVTVNATDYTLAVDNGPLTVSKTFQLRVTNLSITDPPEVQDAPSSIAVGVVNEDYNKTLLASGGAQPYTWKVIAGQQPDGLSLNQYTGVISGTPTQLGTYVFLVELTDNDGIKAQRLISHTVSSFSITTSGLPNVVVGNLYNTTVSAEGGVKNSLTGYYRWEMGGQPASLAINFDTGEIYNTSAMISNDVGLYTVTVNATDYTLAVDNGPLTVSKTFQLRVTNLSITDPPEAVGGAPSSIAVGVVNEDYNKTLLASGGAQPYTWKVIAGQQPDGLSLNQYTGVISGTPTQLGTYVFLVELTDNSGITAQRLISHTVSSFSITTVELPNVVVGNLYNTTVSAEGGVKNSLTGYYRWEMGGQPSNLAINFDTGEIYNTSAMISNDVGLYTVTVNATDYTLAVDNGPLTVSKTFQLRVTNLSITDPPEVQGAPSSIAVGVVNEDYNKTLLAFGGAQPYTWKVIAGQQPDGLSLNQYTGVISGTPTQLGTYVFLVELTDNSGITAQRLISHTVSSFSITTSGLPNVVVGNLYNTTVSAEGGVKNSLTGEYRWEIGGQPASLAINFDTGEIYNTSAIISNDVGLYTVTVNATDYTLAVDNGPLTVSRTFQLRVTNLSITDPPEALGGAPSSIAVGVVNEDYNKTLLASGGAQPYAWKVIAGQQPDGLTLNQYTGVISGTPTQLGTYVFLVELTDNDGIKAQRLISHTVSSFSITTVELPNVVVGNLYNTTVSAEGGVKNSLTGEYRWEMGGQPSNLAINFDTGEIYNTGAIISNDVGLYTVIVNATDYTLAVDNGPLTVSSTFQLRVTNLSITDPLEVLGAPSSITVGVLNEEYSKTLLGSGGTQPYAWKVIAGQLPDGLSLNQYTGVLSGTPTQLGTYVYLVELTDNSGIKAQRLISHTVASFSITTVDLPNAVVGNNYLSHVIAEGGVKNSLTGDYHWEMSGQPSTIAINATTGEIYNTSAIISNNVGLYTLVINATDSTPALDNGPLTVSRTFLLRVTNLSITDPLEVLGAPSSITVGVVNETYSKTLLGSGGALPYTWKVIAGQLPEGISLNQYTGVLSGTPTQLGTYVYLVELTDNDGIKAQRLISHTVASFSITTTELPNVVVGNLYNTTVSAEGGVKNSLTGYYRWEMGGQPSSLAINVDTGEIYNTGAIISNNVGLYTVTVNATDYTLAVDNGPLTVSRTFQLRVTNLSIIDPPEALGGVPSSIAVGVLNEAYNKTLVGSGGTQPYTWKITAGQQPEGISLNQYTGVLSGTPTQLGTYVFLVELTDDNGITAERLISHTVSEFSITTTELPNAVVGTVYLSAVVAEGGVKNSLTGEYRWEMGGQPSTIAINANTGEIYNSGAMISSNVGLYTVTVNATDYTLAVDNGPLTVSRTFQLRVTDLSIIDPPEILGGVPSPIAVGVLNEAYNKTLVGSGGALPYTWKVIAGQQPDGLTLNPNTGVISGTPTQFGTYVFLVELTDNDGITAERLISHTVSEFSITTTELPNAVVGTSYDKIIVAEGGTKDPITGYYQWLMVGQPASLFIDPATGKVINTSAVLPAEVGLYTVTVNATDYTTPQNLTVSRTFKLRVTDLDIVTTPYPYVASTDTYQLKSGPINVDYETQLTAVGGSGIYNWTYISGSLPPGLNLDPITGRVYGIPSVKGTYVFRVQITDEALLTAQKKFEITIADLVISTEELVPASQGILYNQSLTATGGDSPYTWTITGLPTGLSLINTAGNWTIEGTTTVPKGSYTVSLTVTDSKGIFTSRSYSLTVTDIVITTASPIVPAGTIGVPYSASIDATGGTGFISWRIVAGGLPDGLSLCSAGFVGRNCLITGTPSSPGTTLFRVELTDLVDNISTFKDFELSVSDLQIISTEADIPIISIGKTLGTVTDPGIQMVATGGTPPYTWTVPTWDSLTGLAMSAGGLITGTVPAGTVEKRYLVTVQVTDSSVPPIVITKTFDANPVDMGIGFRVTSLYLYGVTYGSITIGDGVNWMLPVGDPGGLIYGGGSSGSSTAYVWSVVAGSVPTGMTFSSSTGITTGVPSAPGYYTWRVRLMDDVTNIYVEDNFSIQIFDPSYSGADSGGSTFCFIATAAYGSYLSGDVVTLRSFRDNYMIDNELGRQLVSFYYRNSPPLADFISRHETLRQAARFAITPIVYAVKYPLPLFGMVFFAGAVAAAARSRKKKA